MDEEKWNELLAQYDDPKVLEYLNDLDDKDKEIILIAFYHLESSFSVKRSNGFQNWLKKKI